VGSLITGAIGIIGTVAGVTISELFARARRMADVRHTTALELAEMEPFIWPPTEWVDLEVKVQRLDASLLASDVPDGLRDAFRTTTRACWRYTADEDEMSGGAQIGLSMSLVAVRRAIDLAVLAFLQRSGTARQRRADMEVVVGALAKEKAKWEGPGRPNPFR
jgi:hypothetical protein